MDTQLRLLGPYLPVHGWRRTAAFNTIFVVFFSFVLTILVIWSSLRAGGNNRNFIFYQGDCDVAGRTNLFLHLLLNVFSTGLIASSNFFMQVLNSPSRAEVDAAHASQGYLEIGVPSIRNVFHVSWFKKISWAIFVLSSVPIHLFFNSAIFETDYQGTDWHMTLASESFLNGSSYYPPGASLIPAGFGNRNGDSTYAIAGALKIGYGVRDVPMEEYLNSSSALVKNLSIKSTTAQGWKRLEAKDCRAEYAYCKYRRQYRDMIMVLRDKTDAAPNGWVRSTLFALDSNQTAFWDRYMPANQPNSLWFSTDCAVYVDRQMGCDNQCAGALGSDFIDVGPNHNYINQNHNVDATTPTWTYQFINDQFENVHYINTTRISRPRNFSSPVFNEIDVEYCLVEEVFPNCKVGLSNSLLLAVALCVLVKASQCILVLFKIRDDPLVTPGDAIASYLANPDPHTLDCSAMSIGQFHYRIPTPLRAGEGQSVSFTPGPRKWHDQARYPSSGIPRSVLFRTYALLSIVIAATLGIFAYALSEQPLTSGVSQFLHPATSNPVHPPWLDSGAFLPSVLTANAPQLVLSLSYFVYNSLQTRILTEREWNSFSLETKPLRVTNPRGEQRSTYRLQLPYRYSIPLLILSTLLHWLVSATIYVYIIEGGYYQKVQGLYYQEPMRNLMPGLGFADDAWVAVGYSTTAILVVLIIALLMMAVSIWLGKRRLKSQMVVGGSNSLVISAACHASTVGLPETAGSPLRSTEDMGVELQSLLSPEAKGMHGEHRLMVQEEEILGSRTNGVSLDSLLRLSRGSLRWGAVKMPPTFQEKYDDMQEWVGHLSFGSAEQDVEEPRHGCYYA